MCFYIAEAHCLIPYILLSSKPQLQIATTGNSTAPPPWSDLYTYAHTELDENHTIERETLPAVWIFPLQRSCKPSITSFVTPPYIKKIYSWSRSCCTLCLRVFKLNCWVASGRQSSGGVVVKAFLLALHDKDNSFFVKSKQLLCSTVYCKCTIFYHNALRTSIFYCVFPDFSLPPPLPPGMRDSRVGKCFGIEEYSGGKYVKY